MVVFMRVRLKYLFQKIMIFFAHFKTIKDDPGKFILWILTSIGLSLSTVWLPTLLGALIKKDFFSQLMTNNPFVVFSVVFLSNTVLTAINYIGAGTNRIAVTIRGITLVMTILYLIFLSAIIPLKLLSGITLDHTTQFILLGITLLIGIYVYGFRDANWEKSVDDVRNEQEKEIKGITVKASTATSAGNDVKI
jgi:hypothetical protein